MGGAITFFIFVCVRVREINVCVCVCGGVLAFYQISKLSPTLKSGNRKFAFLFYI